MRRAEKRKGSGLTCSEAETEENGPRSALEEDSAGDDSDCEGGSGLDDDVGEAEIRLGGEGVLRFQTRHFRHNLVESNLRSPPLSLFLAGNLAQSNSIEHGSGEGALLAHQERSSSLATLERERRRSVRAQSSLLHAETHPTPSQNTLAILDSSSVSLTAFLPNSPPLTPTLVLRTRSLLAPAEALESTSRMAQSSPPPA